MEIKFEKKGKEVKVWREGTKMMMEVEGVRAMSEAVKKRGQWGFRAPANITKLLGVKGSAILANETAEAFAQEIKEASKNISTTKLVKNARRSFVQHDIDRQKKGEYTDEY